jgi:hypothetical protein
MPDAPALFFGGGGLYTARARAQPPPPPQLYFWVEVAYTQQGRATSRRLHPRAAARPALANEPSGPAAHSVEPTAAVRTEATASPRPCLGCAVELALRIAPLRRVPPVYFFFGGGCSRPCLPARLLYCFEGDPRGARSEKAHAC